MGERVEETEDENPVNLCIVVAVAKPVVTLHRIVGGVKLTLSSQQRRCFLVQQFYLSFLYVFIHFAQRS